MMNDHKCTCANTPASTHLSTDKCDCKSSSSGLNHTPAGKAQLTHESSEPLQSDCYYEGGSHFQLGETSLAPNQFFAQRHFNPSPHCASPLAIPNSMVEPPNRKDTGDFPTLRLPIKGMLTGALAAQYAIGSTYALLVGQGLQVAEPREDSARDLDNYEITVENTGDGHTTVTVQPKLCCCPLTLDVYPEAKPDLSDPGNRGLVGGGSLDDTFGVANRQDLTTDGKPPTKQQLDRVNKAQYGDGSQLGGQYRDEDVFIFTFQITSTCEWILNEIVDAKCYFYQDLESDDPVRGPKPKRADDGRVSKYNQNVDSGSATGNFGKPGRFGTRRRFDGRRHGYEDPVQVDLKASGTWIRKFTVRYSAHPDCPCKGDKTLLKEIELVIEVSAKKAEVKKWSVK